MKANQTNHDADNPPGILVIDVGGNNVKLLASGQSSPLQFESGPTMTVEQMVQGVTQTVQDWKYDRVSIGYPGPVHDGRPTAEPHNLAGGWVGFDYEAAFGHPVKMINDAAMQALGSYEGGKMLFLGLGTGLGSAMVIDGIVAPMELAHLPYRKHTFEYYVGRDGLKRAGSKKWRRYVDDIVARLGAALQPDYVVLGGGNARRLKKLPPLGRAGDNANAFRGGFRLWEGTSELRSSPPAADGAKKSSKKS